MNKSESFSLTEEEKKTLLLIAHKAIANYLEKNTRLKLKQNDFSKTLNAVCGAFVSIYVNSDLRGCIGQFETGKTPLIEVVAESAFSAAFNDNRFLSIEKEELNKLKIEISVLTPLKPLKSLKDFELGKHGIYIKKDFRSGTFLPQVAEKTKWSKEEFISHCSESKAGLGWNGWKSADLFSYEAIIFKD